MNRRMAAIGLLALLVAGAGCSALGPGSVNRERLAQDADYDWTLATDARITVHSDSYQAVMRIENRSEIELFRFFRLNNRRPIDPAALAFQYPNGTVVNHTAMSISKTRSVTVVTLPASEGTLAYTVAAPGKRLRIPVHVDGGSYEVVLPPGTRVQYFLIGRVRPSGYETTIDAEDRVHVTWDAVERDRIVIRYYLIRDLYIFAGISVLAGGILVGGLAYFYLQLRALRSRREDVALDVDSGDDSDGPFP